MRIELIDVSKGRAGSALPTTSVSFHSGGVTLARAETSGRPTVLGLIASGRMRPDTGSVLLDGESNLAQLRRRTALVDAPDVSDPAPDVTVAGIAAEELMFAGRPSHRTAVRRALDDLGLADHSRTAIGSLQPTARIGMLCELALLRDGVDALVLVAPDRHGGDPTGWWQLLREYADRGVAVLAVAGDASAAAIAAASLLDRLDDVPPTDDAPTEHPTTDGAPAADIPVAENAPDDTPAEGTQTDDVPPDDTEDQP